MAKRKVKNPFLSLQDIRKMFYRSNRRGKQKKSRKSLSEWRNDIRSELSVGSYSLLHTVAGYNFMYPSKRNKIFLAKFLWTLMNYYDRAGVIIPEDKVPELEDLSLDKYIQYMGQTLEKYIGARCSFKSESIENTAIRFMAVQTINNNYELPTEQSGIYLSWLLPDKFGKQNKHFKKMIPMIQGITLLTYFLPISTDLNKDYICGIETGDGEDIFHQRLLEYYDEHMKRESEDQDEQDSKDWVNCESIPDYYTEEFFCYCSERGMDTHFEIEQYDRYKKGKDIITDIQDKIMNKLLAIDVTESFEELAVLMDDVILGIKKTKCPSFRNTMKDLVRFEMIQEAILKCLQQIRSNRDLIDGLIKIAKAQLVPDNEDIRTLIGEYNTVCSNHHVIFFTEHSYIDFIMEVMYKRTMEGEPDFHVEEEERIVSLAYGDTDVAIEEVMSEEHEALRTVTKFVEPLVSELIKELYDAYKQT